MHRQRGFTLMELMVAVAIVGILAALALPSYSSYRLKTNRPIGSGCLLEAQRRIETVYQHTNNYPADLTGAGYAAATFNCGDQSATAQTLYSIALSLPDSSSCPKTTCFQLTATAQGGQLKDGNLQLTYHADKLSPSDRQVKQHLPPGTSTWLDSWDFQPGH